MKEIVRIKTISEVHRIFGLEKPKHPLVSLIPIDDKITNFDYGDAKYVFDFYQVNMKEGFSGSLNYGRNDYDFEEGSLIFIKPQQSIQVEPMEEVKGSSGWTLLFHPDLIRKSELGKSIEDYAFFNYALNEALQLSDEEKKSLNEIVRKIEEEYSQNIDKHSQELIIANIEMLLKYSKRFYDRQFYTRTNLNKDVIDEFNSVVTQYYRAGEAAAPRSTHRKTMRRQPQPIYKLPKRLIKAETGMSAKSHIQEYVIQLAKTKLLGTNETISEIAYSLGFEYPQGFNKLFKSKVGQSPSAYRNVN